MGTGGERIRAFDWIKGLAVMVMIQTHTLALLRVDLLGDSLVRSLNWIDGLVAPSFILTSGFALALVQVRGASAGSQLRRARQSLRRILEVLLVSGYMTSLWFDVLREPKWLLRIDILSCIGLALFAALPLFALLAHRPRILAGVSGGLGVGILMATPLVWDSASGLAGQLFTNIPSPTSSPFPLFPWSGYVFLGGALGALAARASRRVLASAVVGLGLVGSATWAISIEMMANAPRWRWWVSANHSQRVIVVSTLVLAMLALERLMPRPGRGLRVLEIFGTSSLAAYFGHEVMLFKNLFGVCFNTFWGKAAGWPLYWTLTAALLVLAFGFTWGVAYLYDHARGWLGRGLVLVRRRRPT